MLIAVLQVAATMLPQPFPPTRWSVILSAKDVGGEDSHQAVEALALAYWQPIFAWLRGQGRTHEEAEDDAQGFFAFLLSRDFLRNVQPEGGRFRNFLLVCLRRWMRDERVRVINVKRLAEVPLEPCHESESAVFSSQEATPQEAFDRAWAQAVVARTMKALAQRWEARADLYDALRLTVENPGGVEKHAAIAAQLGMTEGAVSKAAHDLRKQFAGQVRTEIRDTVARDEDVEEELRYLVTLMKS
jgi:RNA polymerase sigma-70 factor (ECF subfamily)